MLVPILTVVAVVATVFSLVISFLYFQALKKLGRYGAIQDIEAYKRQCEVDAQNTTQLAEKVKQEKALEAEVSALETKRSTERRAQIEQQIRQYQSFLGKLKTVDELRKRIETDTAKIKHLNATLGNLQRAVDLKEFIANQEKSVELRRKEIKALSEFLKGAHTAKELAARVEYYENYISQLKADVGALEEASELSEFGYYRPQFSYPDSPSYKNQLDNIRKRQKQMLKNKTACYCHTEWTIDGNKREGQKMVNQQIKLMLRAFNGECDAAIGKVKFNNIVALENRINKSFEAINKLGETKQVSLAHEFNELRLAELHLAHEYQEKKQEEKEEQQQIREQMREEAKIAKEIEKEQKKADQEESLRRSALEQARRELEATQGAHTEKLSKLVSKLELELAEAIDRKAKAIARAQLTRSGHVYVLSNIGTFGENVYKIGMTRRLEPLERVRELGGASVPFPFDVHAMIYSEDAPALENSLHRHFNSRRVNLVNLRREFFSVTLEEIQAAVAENFGHISFTLVAEAEQYRKTIALKQEQQDEAATLQIA